MTGAKNGYFAWVAGSSNSFPAPAPGWGATEAEARAELLARGTLYPGQRVETATWSRAPAWVHQDAAEAQAHEGECATDGPHTPGHDCAPRRGRP